MNTRIEKRIGVRATSDRVWEILTDLPHWSRWNPYEGEIEGAITFGGSLALSERLPDQPERRSVVRIAEWQPLAQLVWTEKRGFLFSTMRYFEIDELDRGSCVVAHGTIFNGLRGELFHDRHRPAIRAAYEEIAENLRVLAEA